MNVSVIGTGNMGSALVRRLITGGNTVYVAGSSLKKAQALAAELKGQGPGSVEAVSDRDAAARGDVVILATWYPVATRLAVELSDTLRGKIVVDITNPFNETYDALITDDNTSAGEEIQRRLPGSPVVKAFNTNFAPVLGDGEIDGVKIDVFLACDDDAAKAIVGELVNAAGLRAVNAGALANARLLERIALFMVELQGRYGLEFQAAMKFFPARSLPLPAPVEPQAALA
jgi:NADPH-dependent F420 reductase